MLNTAGITGLGSLPLSRLNHEIHRPRYASC